jgi:hypothetical protein
MARILRIMELGWLAALPVGAVLAQEFKFQAEVNSIPININGVKVHSPFTGGFSFSKPALGDIDADGDLDLFVGDSFGAIAFYENIGTAAAPSFEVRTGNFASINVGRDSAPALVDIDDDNDLDMFVGEEGGNINFFRNHGTPLVYKFILETEAYDSIAVGLGSMPAFADVDNDGDQDLFIGEKDGNVNFYRNAGTAASSDFILESENLGDINVGRDSAPNLVDIDNDGDFDLFIGEDGGDINFCRNTSSAPDTLFVLEAEQFSGIHHGTDSVPIFADLDNDGDADLLVTEYLGNLNFYRNTGTASQPELTLEIENFATLDVGTNSAPTWVDIDDDGDQDLFVGKNSGRIAFYRNTGDDRAPSFTLETENLSSVSGPINVGSFSIPAFADIDNDGDFDLFIGEFDGNVNFYMNAGTPAEPSFQLMAAKLGGIDVGSNSAPALTDIDDDGDFDLFVGAKDGTISFFRNAGKAIDSTFSPVGEKFESIDAGDDAVPLFIDVDLDGDEDLFIGKDRGSISFYRNMGTASAPAFPASEATGSFVAIDIGNDSAPALVDIDNDGDVDLFLGEREGGLYFFRRIPGTTGVTFPETKTLAQDFMLEQNYPNPFNPETTVQYRLPKASRVTLTIYNLFGQRVATLVDEQQLAGLHTARWNGINDSGRRVASGIYLYSLQVQGFSQSRKLVLLH